MSLLDWISSLGRKQKTSLTKRESSPKLPWELHPRYWLSGWNPLVHNDEEEDLVLDIGRRFLQWFDTQYKPPLLGLTDECIQYVCDIYGLYTNGVDLDYWLVRLLRKGLFTEPELLLVSKYPETVRDMVREHEPPWDGTVYEDILHRVEKIKESPSEYLRSLDESDETGLDMDEDEFIAYIAIKEVLGDGMGNVVGTSDAPISEDETPLLSPVSTLPTLQGKKFVVTGTLTRFTRAEVEHFIQQAGGTVLGAVSGSCDYLVVGDKPGSKLLKAQELDIPVITEDELLQMAGAL